MIPEREFGFAAGTCSIHQISQQEFQQEFHTGESKTARTSGCFCPKRQRKMSLVGGTAREKMGASTKNHRVDSWVGVEFQGVFDIQNEPTCLVQKIRNFKIWIISWRGRPRSSSGCTRVREGRGEGASSIQAHENKQCMLLLVGYPWRLTGTSGRLYNNK